MSACQLLNNLHLDKGVFKKKMSVEEKKLGEIERLQRLMSANSLSFEDIAELSGASVRTAKNIVYENKPLGMKLIRGLAKKTGVSLDWLLTGEGSMYRNAPRTTYEANGIAVHNNHGNINAGSISAGAVERGERLCGLIQRFLQERSGDEAAWLEQQILRAVPEFKDWLQGKR